MITYPKVELQRARLLAAVYGVAIHPDYTSPMMRNPKVKPMWWIASIVTYNDEYVLGPINALSYRMALYKTLIVYFDEIRGFHGRDYG